MGGVELCGGGALRHLSYYCTDVSSEQQQQEHWSPGRPALSPVPSLAGQALCSPSRSLPLQSALDTRYTDTVHGEFARVLYRPRRRISPREMQQPDVRRCCYVVVQVRRNTGL